MKEIPVGYDDETVIPRRRLISMLEEFESKSSSQSFNELLDIAEQINIETLQRVQQLIEDYEKWLQTRDPHILEKIRSHNQLLKRDLDV